ncbi:MAG: hypothetical protein RMJ87_11600 [Cytophagales bacterium]|nr:hypothetical protein [Bernardetiaceae bacterium]MDW8205665.1 hypothetical protein [Cytophagales bacterium]
MATTGCEYYTIATGQQQRQWHYHYTYYYQWLRQHENILSHYCTDGGQQLSLTAKRLLVASKHIKRDLPLQKIKRVSLQFRRLTFPLIVGAVVGCFAALATYKGIISYWIGISLTISGFILAYYGWLGSWQINVELTGEHTLHYFTDRRTPQLDEFINKANQQLAWFQVR